MSEDQIQALWKKSDEHATAINDLKVQQSLNSALLDRHDEEFRKMHRDTSSNHAQVMTVLADVKTDLNTVMTDFHERQGQSRAVRVYLPILLTVVGLALTYLAFFQ